MGASSAEKAVPCYCLIARHGYPPEEYKIKKMQ